MAAAEGRATRCASTGPASRNAVATSAQPWWLARINQGCGRMNETVILETMESKRSYGFLGILLAVLALGLPFLGRQRVRVTSERIVLEQGFWNKVRDDVEIFRIRDVVVKQNIWNRIFGIGDIVIKSTEGRTEETHTLRGVPGPVAVSETIRTAWNNTSRPRGPSMAVD